MGSSRKRSDGAGTVIARKNGTFTAQISDEGRRRSIGTFATRKKAEHALAAAMVEGAPPSIDTRLGDYLQEWLADRVLLVKPTTLARDCTLIRNHVLEHRIARKRVRDLRPDDFRLLYRELRQRGRADGGPLAASTVATLDTVLKVALQRLVDDRKLTRHPIPRRIVGVEQSGRPWLSTDEVRELIRFARFADPDLEDRRETWCPRGTSAREDLRSAVAIRRNRVVANGHAYEHSPKTAGSHATVPLDSGTVTALRRHQRAASATD